MGWFHAHEGKKIGPLGLDDLRAQVQQGRLKRTDMLLPEGATQWVEAGSLVELFAADLSANARTEVIAPARPEDTAAFVPVLDSAGALTLDAAAALRARLNRDAETPAIPGYEMLGLLGKGGMGVVYKARQLKLDRLVALKMILSGAHAGGDELVRFLNEARAVARLRHPNIVQVYEIGDHEGRLYIALEFCEGGSLDGKLHGTPQPAREAAELVETLARAVQAAHEAGIVHRDLKPANVLLAACGLAAEAKPQATIPKITDFGLAKKLGDIGQTQTGVIVGTPAYMAPEQASGGSLEVGPAADVYALGVILYECLTGRVPFAGATPMDTLHLVTDAEPVPPRRLAPHCPADLETICLHCLHKEPGRRYVSALAFADDLKRFLAGEPIRARPVGRVERLWRWGKRNPALAAVSLLLLVSLLAGSSVIVWKWREAVANYDLMEIEKARAEKGQEEAVLEKQEANRQRGIAEKKEAESRRYVYASLMHQIPEAYERGDLQTVQRYLEEFEPRGEQKEDPRGFEWWHYQRLARGSRLTVFGHTGTVTTLAVAPDGTTFASGARDLTVRLWDTKTGKERRRFPSASVPTSLAFSPDGQYLVVANGQFTAVVHDLRDEKRQHVISSGRFQRVAYPPDGSVLALGGSDGTLSLYSPNGRQQWAKRAGAHKAHILTAAFSGEGRLLVTGGADGWMRVWELKGAQKTLQLDLVAEVQPHSGTLGDAVLSPDGRLVVSGGSDRLVKLWELDRVQRTLTLRTTFRGHTANIWGVALTPDGKRLVSSSFDRTARVWDVAAGKQLAILRGHGKAVHSLALSKDGKTLITAGEDAAVKVWDLDRLPSQSASSIDGGGVNSLAFAPGKPLLASAADDGSIKLWDTRIWKEQATLTGHPDAVRSVLFLPDGRTLASAGNEPRIRLWDVLEGKERGRIALSAAGSALALSPDGKELAAGDDRGWVTVHDLASRHPLLAIRNHHGRVTSLAFAPNGRQLASASWDCTLNVLELSAPQRHPSLRSHFDRVLSVAFTPDGSRLLSSGKDDTICLTDFTEKTLRQPVKRDITNYLGVVAAPDGKSLYWMLGYGETGALIIWRDVALPLFTPLPRVPLFAGRVRSIALDDQGTTLALGADDGTIALVEAASGKVKARVAGHARAIRAVACSPDGRTIAIAGADFTVRLIDAATRRERAILRGHEDVVTALAFSRDGQRLFSASQDRTVRLWDTAEGASRGVWRDFKDHVRDICISPDGKLLATAGGVIDMRSELHLRDAETGRLLRELKGHRWMVRGLAFSPDGRILATVSGDGWAFPGEIKLWDVASGEERLLIAGHSLAVSSVAFSPDGRTLATAGHDRVIRLWEIEEGARGFRPGPSLEGHEGLVRALAFSRDGRTLVSTDSNRTLRFWQPRLGEPLGTLRLASEARCLAFTPDGRTLLVGQESGDLAWLESAVEPEAASQPAPAGRMDLSAESMGLLARARARLAMDTGSVEKLREADALFEALTRNHPDLPVYQRERIETLLQTQLRLSNKEELEGRCRLAVRLAEQCIERGQTAPEDRLLVARARRMLADSLSRQEDRPGAEQEYRAALELLAGLLAERPEDGDCLWEAALARKGLGAWLVQRKRSQDAEQELRRALEHLDNLGPEEATLDANQEKRAEVLAELVPLLAEKSAAHIDALYHLVRLRELRSFRFPQSDRLREEAAQAYRDLSRAQLETHPREAIVHLLRAVENWKLARDRNLDRMDLRSRFGEAAGDLGRLLYRHNRFAEAAQLLALAIPDQRAAYERAPGTARERILLGNHLELHANVLNRLGKHREAAAAIEERLKLEADQGERLRRAAGALANSAAVAHRDLALSMEERSKRAKEHADRAMELLERAVKVGYKEVENLETAPALEVLRKRDDFKKLLERLRQ